MLNCVPVVVKGEGGGGGGCVGKSATGEIASEEPRRPFAGFLFLSFSLFFEQQRERRRESKNLRIWVADAVCRRKETTDKGFSKRRSSIFRLTSSLHGNASTSNIYPEVEERRWKYFHDRSIDRTTCCLSISKSRTARPCLIHNASHSSAEIRLKD